MNPTKTTLFDIMTSAAATAQNCIDSTTNQRKDDLAIASLKLEAFNAASFDRADFACWATNVEDMINKTIVWRNTPSPAAQAAMAAQKSAS